MSAGLPVARGWSHSQGGKAGPPLAQGSAPSPFPSAPSSFLPKKHTADPVTFVLSAEWTCSPREGKEVVGTSNQPCQLRLRVGPHPLSGGSGPEREQGPGGLVPSHTHSSMSHVPWGPPWARGNSMSAEGAWEQGVCVCSHKVCALSNSLVTPAPRAGNVASPQPWSWRRTHVMESRKTLVPPPEARQLKVVAVWWWVFVSLCAWLLGSPNCYLTWLPDSLSTPCRLGPPPPLLLS